MGFLARLYFTTIFLPGYVYHVDDLGREIQDSGIENETQETQLTIFSVLKYYYAKKTNLNSS